MKDQYSEVDLFDNPFFINNTSNGKGVHTTTTTTTTTTTGRSSPRYRVNDRYQEDDGIVVLENQDNTNNGGGGVGGNRFQRYISGAGLNEEDEEELWEDYSALQHHNYDDFINTITSFDSNFGTGTNTTISPEDEEIRKSIALTFSLFTDVIDSIKISLGEGDVWRDDSESEQFLKSQYNEFAQKRDLLRQIIDSKKEINNSTGGKGDDDIGDVNTTTNTNTTTNNSNTINSNNSIPFQNLTSFLILLKEVDEIEEKYQYLNESLNVYRQRNIQFKSDGNINLNSSNGASNNVNSNNGKIKKKKIQKIKSKLLDTFKILTNGNRDNISQRNIDIMNDSDNNNVNFNSNNNSDSNDDDDVKVIEKINTTQDFNIIELIEPGECPICYDDSIEPGQFFQISQCQHSYCMTCMRDYISTKLGERLIDIPCPTPKCTSYLQYGQIKYISTPELFDRYEQMTLNALLLENPNYKWCPNPNGQCSNIVYGEISNPRTRCSNTQCNFDFCFRCSEPWHPDSTCEQHQQWKLENSVVDQKYQVWIKSNNAKKCPKCKTLTEKGEGCNHITCSQCRYNWCWLCGGKYTHAHFDTFNPFGCPGLSHSRNLTGPQRIALKSALGTGLLLGGVVAISIGIPVAIVGLPIYGIYKGQRYVRFHINNNKKYPRRR